MNKFRWRIYTELIKGGQAQKAVVDRYFKGYTVYQGVGVWEGAKENNMTIEIIGGEFDRVAVLELVTFLRDDFDQKCVLVTEEPVKAFFI